MGIYAIYLRKSRADLDAEARGEGETLARHRRALTELAERQGYFVETVYEEIASADSIAARPQMQLLLDRVQRGDFAGVIVNDVDRLGRGDSIDQGIIKQSFYSTNTLIITPRKIYDPAVESDEDGFEFSLFFARYEYRQITRRLHLGRHRSAQEGNYVAAYAAYGFTKGARSGRGARLTPDPDTAPVARLMLGMLIDDRMPVNDISARLNAMGYRTRRGQKFTPAAVRSILRNPALAGHTLSRKTTTKTVIRDGQRVKVRLPNDAPLLVKNTHPGICAQERFDAAQAILDHGAPRTPASYALVNPLAGLIVCAECGRAMKLKGGGSNTLRCPQQSCPTTGIDYRAVEDAILDMLGDWLYTGSAADPNADRSSEIRALTAHIESLKKQLARQYDLLEQGVYTADEFVYRRADLGEKIAAAEAKRSESQSTASEKQRIAKLQPTIRHVLDAYPSAKTPEDKNRLLKSLLSEVAYHKTHKCRPGDTPSDYLKLELFVRRTD